MAKMPTQPLPKSYLLLEFAKNLNMTELELSQAIDRLVIYRCGRTPARIVQEWNHQKVNFSRTEKPK